ncbi:MAG TPA: YbjN domain-containing protein [Pilimelia sp.]|nr:YbjN domain-containing protein [Pilimelia sp.]
MVGNDSAHAPEAPVRALFAALARLHQARGAPGPDAIAAATALPPDTVEAVLHGPRLPHWEALAAIGAHLGGDREDLLRLWVAARDVAGGRPAAALRPRVWPEPNPDPPRRGSRSGGAGLAPELPRVTVERLCATLTAQGVHHLRDGNGSVVTLWERHAAIFALEGPADEILLIRARPHATVPADWTDRAYRVLNEWNHSRRFLKTYVGDPTHDGRLPLYGEMQIPFGAGAHDAQLAEWVDCAAGVAAAWVAWLYDDGGLL